MRHLEVSISRVSGSLQRYKSKRGKSANIVAVWSSELLKTGALKRLHQRTALQDTEFGQSELGSL